MTFQIKYLKTIRREIVGNVGPITVLICLEESFYHVGDEGVYKVDDCCRATEHAPAIVGYGTDPEHGDYWILRNSWGLKLLSAAKLKRF